MAGEGPEAKAPGPWFLRAPFESLRLGCYTRRMAKDPTNRAAERFNEVCTIRIELLESAPPIWRRVDVPTSVTLKLLHEIVQIVMDWQNYHLWEFTVGARRYGIPSDEDYGDTPLFDGANIRLRDVLRRKVAVLDYTYDFGDNWELRLTATDVRQREPNVSYPRYIDGERNGPPEDCGGIYGFYDKLEARRDRRHPDHRDVSRWLGNYDAAKIDTFRMRHFLAQIAKRRKAGRARWDTEKA